MDEIIGSHDLDIMSLRLRQSKALDIALRLPPLFLMDQLLLYDMGINLFQDTQHFETNTSSIRPHFHFTFSGDPESPGSDSFAGTNVTSFFNDTNLDQAYHMLYGNLHWILLPHLLHFFSCVGAYGGAAFVLTLNTRELLVFYTYVLATMCTPFSYACNKTLAQYMSAWFTVGSSSNIISGISGLEEVIKLFSLNLAVQALVSYVLSTVLWIHLSNNASLALITRCVTISFMAPSILSLFFDYNIMRFVIIASVILPAALTAFAQWQVVGSAYRSVIDTITAKRQFVANFGLNTFIEAEWVRLRVPSLLRTFWLARFTQQLFGSLLNLSAPLMPTTSETATKLAVDTMIAIAKDLLTRGVETFIAVLGLTSIVSTVCHYIGSFFYFILTSGGGGDNDEEKSVASVSAVLFFVLSLQTGLTSLDPEKRFSRLCKNLCLLITALFHFIHNMVNPVLMSLSASHNLNSSKHMRALGICFFLVVTPLSLMVYLWCHFSIGTWLLAVSSFCIEVVIKVGVTVTVYALFLYDARARHGNWEGLDDAVYYVKAVGNSIEFCFAVFLFFNGGWILFFESGGTIRALMMLIHAYCNIWLEAKSGWQTFMKRRTAVAKINALPDAEADDLASLDDVCAICYQEMTTTAKITRCRHFFHAVCLRKWLYVQDTCPLCHSALYNVNNVTTEEDHPAAAADTAANPDNHRDYELPRDHRPDHEGSDEELNHQIHPTTSLPRLQRASSSSSSSSSALDNTSNFFYDVSDDNNDDDDYEADPSCDTSVDDSENSEFEVTSSPVPMASSMLHHRKRRSDNDVDLS